MEKHIPFRLMAIFALLTLAIYLFSCDDNEPTDLLPGKWVYESSGSGPEIQCEFRITLNDGVYIVNEIKVNINGDDQKWDYFEIEGVQKGKFVKNIAIIGNGGISFYGNRHSNGKLLVDSVYYVESAMPVLVQYKYTNQVIARID